MFEQAFAQQVLASLVTPLDRLLDDPETRSPGGLVFFERTYPVDAVVERWLRQSRTDEEWHHQLLGHLLEVHRGLRLQVNDLPALRPATRAEIYRRLVRARDFVDASWAEPLRLSTVAQFAGIAPHRFLRLFKHAFGRTPHRYLTERRLEEARRRLERGGSSVTDVCLAVGLTSLRSFH